MTLSRTELIVVVGGWLAIHILAFVISSYLGL